MEQSVATTPARRFLTPWTMAAGLGGLALAIALFARIGAGDVLGLLAGAGWGIVAVIALHLAQVWLTAIGWRALMPGGAPSRGWLTRLRLIREGINTLLPTAQIGGLVVAARLLWRQGLTPAEAVAATVVDVTVELVTQVAFTLMGVALLMVSLGGLPLAVPLLAGLGVFAAMVVALLGAQRLGLSRLAERAAARFGWTGRVEGARAAIGGLYRRPAALARSAGFHSLAWALGAAEVWLALRFLGHGTGLAEAFVIESLGQTVKAASFAIPGALGAQEGGYVVLCGLFGIPPDAALALSLVKRARELALGGPSIGLWLWMERGGARRPVLSER